jgi:membrane-bound ClpP family serine protease
MTLQTVERRLDQAAKDGCDAAVIELDTPGGELSSTLAICHLIKTHQVGNVVAWVHPNAYSAGAIIALACREIVVSTDSSIGDAAPISIGADQSLQPLPPTERAKLESPILTEVSDSARRNGYDVRLVRAFISAPDELWLLERDDGKRLFADAREYEIAMGEAPDAMHSTTGRLVVPPPVLIDEAPEPTSNETTDASDPMAQLERQAEAEEQFILSSRIAPEERGRWKVLGQVDSATQLVTLRDDEAVRYGLAKALVNTESELLQFFGGTTIVRYDESWSEGLVRFLISWPVRILLIVVMLVGFFLEAATPGIGAFGAIASVAFLVLVGGPALAGLADWWELACIAIGIILIAVEVIVTPGVGIAGIAGGLLLLIGLVFSFTSGDLNSPQTQDDLVIGFFSVLTAFVLSGTCIGFLIRRMPESKLFRRFVLEATVAQRPALAFASAAGMPGVGAIGMAVTDLRPIGRVQFGDMLLEVRSSGGWIGSGRNVRVVAQDGQGLVVEADSSPFPGEGANA